MKLLCCATLAALVIASAAAADSAYPTWGAGRGAEAELTLYGPGVGSVELRTGTGAQVQGEIEIDLDIWLQALRANPQLRVPVCLFTGSIAWDRTSHRWPLTATFQKSGVGQATVFLGWATNATPLADNAEYYIDFKCWQ